MKPIVKVSIKNRHWQDIGQVLDRAGYTVVFVVDMDEVQVEAPNLVTPWDLFMAAAMANGEGVQNAAEKADRAITLRKMREAQ